VAPEYGVENGSHEIYSVGQKYYLYCVIPVADRCQAVGLAGCGHSKIARVRAYYLYCMCLAHADRF